MIKVKQREGNPNAGFDRGFLITGAVLFAILGIGVRFDIVDIQVILVMTVCLWMSVGAAMVIARFNDGRWE